MVAGVNNRVFWACTGIFFCDHGATSTPITDADTGCNTAYGVQSVGITTTFNLEQVFELGQIGLYENIEEVPDIEVTVEKVLDGRALIYDLATTNALADHTDDNTSGANVDLVVNAMDRMDVYFVIADERQQALGNGISLDSTVYCSGMYVSSVSYTLPTDGNCTESVTLVGNDKLWFHNGDARLGAPSMLVPNEADFGPIGSEHVATANTATGVQRRENVLLASSYLPTDIFGVTGVAEGTGTPATIGNANNSNVHLNSISISADLGREAINELGTKLPYYRYVSYPIEVTCEIEVTTISGDMVDAGSHKSNLVDQKIYILMSDSTIFNLGNKNKLASVSYGGGSTGGENATCTYSYSTFNALTVNGPRNDATA